jgi:hypothetical protein
VRALALFALLLATAGAASAEVRAAPQGLRDALAARAMLGDGVWARVVRIDNAGRRPAWRRSAYPKIVFALVFELSGALWFYTDADGTQSLSLTLGTLERDKAAPGPLFLAIDPGFTSWAWIPEPGDLRDPSGPPPANACFVESISALLQRTALGGEADAPELLSYYVDTPFGRLGHTVLLYGTRGGLAAVDPGSPGRPVILPATLGADPRAISAYLWGKPVAAARTLPVRFAGKAPPPGRWAALQPHPSPAG